MFRVPKQVEGAQEQRIEVWERFLKQERTISTVISGIRKEEG